VVVVTGTKRSGTSMWMQVLGAAGLPVVGEAFPGHWGDSLRAANPRGFFESRFRRGIYYRSNPDPKTGAYLHPSVVKRHAVKVFIPGVVRSDIAFLQRVIATVRPWREAVASLEALHELERQWHINKASDEADLDKRLLRLAQSHADIPPAIEWWLETYDLVRDHSVRRYPLRWTALSIVRSTPEQAILPILEWLGMADLDLEAAVAAVDPALARSAPAEVEVDPSWAEVFDAVEQAAMEGPRLPVSLLHDMNRVNREVEARYRRLSPERGVEE